MCGLAGQIDLHGLRGSPEERRTWLGAMGRQLARRGPDDEQYYDDGYLSLVFRRLSIIDLEGGRQPIWNEDRTVMAAVNGEIYNHEDIRRQLAGRHRFASRSDSEVIVHLYEEHGDSLMEALNGMFGFIVWDTEKKRLLMARDRLGIKPLFYAVVGNSLIFASELKALLAHPDCPREFDWRDFGDREADPHGLRTFVRGVRQLPGGKYLCVESGGPGAVRTWWDIRDHFPSPESSGGRDERHYIDRYGELLHDSVHKRLMSDVPVGLFLSGGIDSTLLAAMAADAKRDLHCFTVVEDTTIGAGDVEEAQKACDSLGLPWYPVKYDTLILLDQLEFTLRHFEFLVAAVELPRFHIEGLFKRELHRFARSRVPGLKVILLGQGADEFTGGYSLPMGHDKRTWAGYQAHLANAQRLKRRNARGIPTYMQAALAPGYPPDDETSVFHREMLARTRLLQNYNLWHEDRTSSCHGIESRVPFLDHRIVELMASVPQNLHESLFFNKRIIRAQFARWLPSYPEDKLKVRFYITGDDRTMHRLRAGIVRRVFPEFKRAYLDRPGAIFSAQKLVGFYNQLARGGHVSSRELDDFIDCMAISVFDRMCREGMDMAPNPDFDPPSPLVSREG